MSTPNTNSPEDHFKPEGNENEAQRPAVHGDAEGQLDQQASNDSQEQPSFGQAQQGEGHKPHQPYGQQNYGQQGFRPQGGPVGQYGSSQGGQAQYGQQSFGQSYAQPGQAGMGGYGQGGQPQYGQAGGQFGQQPAFGQQQAGGFGSIFSIDFSRVFTPGVARIVHILAMVVGIAFIVVGLFSFINVLTNDYFEGMAKFEYFLGFVKQTAIGLLVIGASRLFLEFFVNNARQGSK